MGWQAMQADKVNKCACAAVWDCKSSVTSSNPACNWCHDHGVNDNSSIPTARLHSLHLNKARRSPRDIALMALFDRDLLHILPMSNVVCSACLSKNTISVQNDFSIDNRAGKASQFQSSSDKKKFYITNLIISQQLEPIVWPTRQNEMLGDDELWQTTLVMCTWDGKGVTSGVDRKPAKRFLNWATLVTSSKRFVSVGTTYSVASRTDWWQSRPRAAPKSWLLHRRRHPSLRQQGGDLTLFVWSNLDL